MTDCVSPHDLHLLVKNGQPVTLIDVRTPSEFDEVHIPCAQSHPLDRLDPKAILEARRASGGAADATIHLVCRAGPRAEEAARRLAAAGVGPLVFVQGGTRGWEQAGLPVVRGERKVIPLERQVRISAGILVLGGVFGGAFVEPRLYILSGFVGAGLIFAGITGRCGLAYLLGRMPWNRAPSCRI